MKNLRWLQSLLRWLTRAPKTVVILNDEVGPSTKDIERFATFQRTFELMGELFGPESNMACVRQKGELAEIHVACRHCGQRNRLYRTRPIESAVCGACKKFLCVQPGETVRGREDGKPVESKVVN